MALKGWVINRVNRLFTRVDLPPRATPLGEAVMRRTRDQKMPGVRNGGQPEILAGAAHQPAADGELRRGEPRAGEHPYQVSLKGRWSEQGALAVAASMGRGFEISRTPLAGRTLEVEIDDANGNRHVTLPSVVPGRRYVVGCGENCD